MLDNFLGNVDYPLQRSFFPASDLVRWRETRKAWNPLSRERPRAAATENQQQTMQNYCKIIGALAAASALAAGNAQAEVEYELHTGYTSEYLFRGTNLGTDLTEVGIDAKYEWNGLSLSGGVWAAAFDSVYTYDDIDGEIDMYAEVGKDWGFVTTSVGYIYYYNGANGHYGDVFRDQQEVYFSLSHDFGFLNTYLTYFWDVAGDNDGYSELGVSKNFEFNSCLNLEVSSNVGYLVEQGKGTAVTTKAQLNWGFAEHVKVSPFVSLSIALSDDIDTAYYRSGNELVGGTMLTVSF